MHKQRIRFMINRWWIALADFHAYLAPGHLCHHLGDSLDPLKKIFARTRLHCSQGAANGSDIRNDIESASGFQFCQ